MKTQKLNNGIEIPMLGLGVFRLKDEKEAYNTVRKAIELGYRHIDTAMIYENEEAVGKAISDSGVAREDIFLTTKLWNEDIRRDNAQKAIDTSLKKLGVDYVDLYLVHWPVKGKYVSVWEEMEKIYASGKAKAVGVSNYLQHHLEEVLAMKSLVPAVNQLEHHPYLVQNDLMKYCIDNSIRPEAWSPFCARKVNLLDEEVLNAIGKKYNKTAAQVVLRWNIDTGVIVIPKSSNPTRQKENLDIFDFSLSNEDINKINALDNNTRVGSHPDEITF